MEKFKGWGRGGGGDTMQDPKEEEKIGDGMKGGKPLEDNGNGDVMGTVVGETRGEAKKSNRNYFCNHEAKSMCLARAVYVCSQICHYH